MSYVIAVAGKGGTGKTTMSCLSLKYLTSTGRTPILAVDADPNSNIGESMGLEVTTTVGDIRENFMRDPQGLPSGMDKANYLELLMHQAIIDNTGYDLLVMGRQEGSGCYCMVNNILHRFMEELGKEYKYLVVDNEAGMEHLSRRTNGKIDTLFLVSDYSLRGLRAVGRIYELIDDLKLNVGKCGLVLNRAPDTLHEAFHKEIGEMGIELYGTIPDDPALMEYDVDRRSLIDLPDDAPSYQAVQRILSEQIQ